MKTPPILQVSTWSLTGQGHPDRPGDGVRLEVASIRNFRKSFINIGHQDPCQDSILPPSLFL